MMGNKNFEIISVNGSGDLAKVFVARMRGDDGYLVEFVDARDPSLPPDEKWVIIVSTQFGCPISCPICDAGGDFKGNLTAGEIFAEIDHVVSSYPRSRLESVVKLKIQFARMGEPALNPAVLDVVEELPPHYKARGLIPCIATIAPKGCEAWFERLIDIRHSIYKGQPFQLQLSLNSTDPETRDRMMPVEKLSFDELSRIAHNFSEGGPRKVGLNFAMAKGVLIEPHVIARHFDPESCCVKLTPLNPTDASMKAGFTTAISPDESAFRSNKLCAALKRLGFDVILSIGDTRENEIGSNCGMAIRRIKANQN